MTPAELLIAALRSGEYKQGKYALRNNNNEFCCLGVACDLYQKHVGGLIEESVKDLIIYNRSSGVLPEPVQTWLGFRTDNGSFHSGSYLNKYSLSSLNDSGESFRSIADTIEACPDGLFINDAARVAPEA